MCKCNGCDKKFDNNKSAAAHKAVCKKYKKLTENIMSYDVLYDLYCNKKISANDISKQLNFGSASTVINMLKKYDIPTRDISEATKLDNVKIKKEKTNLRKHGSSHNFNKDHPSRIKWQKRLLDEEGITSVFQREDVKRKSVISLYNNGNNKIPKDKEGKTKSKIHLKTLELLEEMNIDFFDEKAISNGETVYFYDVHIYGTKKLIEVNGDFWHANPIKYKENDLVKLPGKPLLAKQIWYNDLKKRNMAEKYGYEILYLWESDFSCIEKIITQIKQFLVEGAYDNESKNHEISKKNKGES